MFNPSAIKSIQYGTCSFGGALSTADATLGTSVTVANCLVFNLGSVSNTLNNFVNGIDFFRVSVLNTTTIRATCSGVAAAGSTVKFVVIEFYGGYVKSSGQRTISLGNSSGSGTDSIGPVVVAKTVVVLTGWTWVPAVGGAVFDGASAYTNALFGPELVLTNTTTVTCTLAADTNNSNVFTRVIGYNYIEFR